MTTTTNKTNVDQVNEAKGQTTDKANKSILDLMGANNNDNGQGSAYGTTVSLCCQRPELLSKANRTELNELLKKANINVVSSKSAITTGLSQTKKIIELLVKYGHIK